MNAKRKRIIKSLALVLAFALLAAGCFGVYILYRFNCNKSDGKIPYDSIYSRSHAVIDVDESGIFNVLKINDTHFFNGKCEKDLQTLEDLKAILDKTDFDLIIVDGDLVEGFSLNLDYDKFSAIDIFATLVEQYSVPWTFAPGNNDGEIDGDNRDIIAYMMQYDHFICGNSDGVYGDMQFFIDLQYNGELVHSMAILDSGMRRPRAIGKYESIKDNQINWLLDGISERKVPVSVFFHMPTPKFEEAYDNGEAYEGFTMCKTFSYLDVPGNKLFDDMTEQNGYIKLISCAHQHSNNMCSLYEGRWYQLSCVSGYSASHHDFINPCVTLTSIDVREQDAKQMYSFSQIEA